MTIILPVMKPKLLRITPAPVSSFSIRQDQQPDVNNSWHYHTEVELIHFAAGSGTQFAGDSIAYFQAGDVVLIGSELPHYWRFDEAYFTPGCPPEPVARVVHFNADFWGKTFLGLPENKALKILLEQAKCGIQVGGKTSRKIAGIMQQLLKSSGPKRIILLMEALLAISKSTEIRLLSSMGFRQESAEAENKRIQAIYDFSFANFRRKILISEVAEIAHVSVNYFCRYFKASTRKTYSRFINEIRVGQACRLLIENKMNLKQVCFESGFYNFASFHQYFKLVTGKSPLHYQREFLQSGPSVFPD